MRTLERNKRTIHYAQLIGSTPIKDEYGNETGEYANEYSPPVPYRIHVSAARGEYTNAQFGGIAHYDRVLVTGDMECPIVETSVLWIDKQDTSKPYDYVVTGIARSLNSIAIAVRKVQIGG